MEINFDERMQMNRDINTLLSYRDYYEHQQKLHATDIKYELYIQWIDICFEFLSKMIQWQEKCQKDINDLQKIDQIIIDLNEFLENRLYLDFIDVFKIILKLLTEERKLVKEI